MKRQKKRNLKIINKIKKINLQLMGNSDSSPSFLLCGKENLLFKFNFPLKSLKY